MVIMKIEGANKTSASTKAGSTGKTAGPKGAAFSSYLSEAEESESAGGLSRVAGVGGMLGMLSVAASEEATAREQRQQTLDYAEDLLADLDALRMGLILGEYNEMQLNGLINRVQNRKQVVGDPALKAVLEDIDLRAQVELAKLQRT
jgi:hypothetical protein